MTAGKSVVVVPPTIGGGGGGSALAGMPHAIKLISEMRIDVCRIRSPLDDSIVASLLGEICIEKVNPLRPGFYPDHLKIG